MPEIKVEIDPEEVGMDSARLERIGTVLLEVPKASAEKSALAVVNGCVSLHD